MRALSVVVLLVPGLALADASFGRSPATVTCGDATWRALAETVETYCREKAAPSERLGCRVARHAFQRCGDGELKTESVGDAGELMVTGAIRDPRDPSYAWLLDFVKLGGRWRLHKFKYTFDDCDAIGIPPPPRGPVRLAEVRLTGQ